MKVLLKTDIDRLGRMGEVVEVARGYARNYLIPRDLAVGVTRTGIKEIEGQKKVLEVKAAREKDRLESVAEKIKAGRVVVKVRCSATGKLFGSITNRQLAQEIQAVTGEEIDRHKIIIADRIRTVGTHPMKIKLHPDVECELEFEVEGEGFVAEEPPLEESEQATEQVAEKTAEPGVEGLVAEEPAAVVAEDEEKQVAEPEAGQTAWEPAPESKEDIESGSEPEA